MRSEVYDANPSGPRGYLDVNIYISCPCVHTFMYIYPRSLAGPAKAV